MAADSVASCATGSVTFAGLVTGLVTGYSAGSATGFAAGSGCMTGVCLVVQSRTGSTRLPGKNLLPWVGDRPLLDVLLERLSKCREIQDLVVATTDLPRDDKIVEVAKSYCRAHRGSERDVLRRFVGAVTKLEERSGVTYAVPRCDIVVRITADCPFSDPQMIDEMLRTFKKRLGLEYASNCHPGRTIPPGFDVEIFKTRALLRAHAEATLDYDREHVTPYIHTHPDTFPIGTWSPDDTPLMGKTYCVDTRADYDRLKPLFNKIWSKNKNFTMEDVLREDLKVR